LAAIVLATGYGVDVDLYVTGVAKVMLRLVGMAMHFPWSIVSSVYL
jgi:hypothetical protein